MKHPLYNGICALSTGKDGDWCIIPAAIGFIHKETAENFEWFIASCIAAGLQLHDKALFADRGKQREAQQLLEQRGVFVDLKFCALHIVFNVCDHFRSVEANIGTIRPYIFQLRATTTLSEYEEVLSEIAQMFPAKRGLRSGSDGHQIHQSVAEYLRKMHPTGWTKCGNCALTLEESASLGSNWTYSKAYGRPCQLFAARTTSAVEGQNNGLLLAGVREESALLGSNWTYFKAYGRPCQLFAARTTSAVEGQNNGLLLAGVCDEQVFGDLVRFYSVVIKTLADKKEKVKDWKKEKPTVTPRAKAKFDRQVDAATTCTVVGSTVSVLLVEDAIRSLKVNDNKMGIVDIARDNNSHISRTFSTDLEAGTCTRCADRQQLQMPCRHIVAALYFRKESRSANTGVFTYFHSCYMASAYILAFENAQVRLPFIPALISDSNILPPPLYQSSRERAGQKETRHAKAEKKDSQVVEKSTMLVPAEFVILRKNPRKAKMFCEQRCARCFAMKSAQLQRKKESHTNAVYVVKLKAQRRYLLKNSQRR